MSDRRVLSPEEKKRRKAEYDRQRRLDNIEGAKAASAAYYQKNKVAIAEKAAARRRANPGADKETKAKWRAANKEHEAAYAAEWARRNPEKRKAIMKKWREANRDVARTATKVWAKRNRPKIREQQREARRKNPAQYRAYVHKRRVLTRGGSLSPDLVDRLMRQQRNKCACCRDKLVDFHLDHIHPLSKGGAHEDSNIQLLCPGCNRTKSNKDPIEFMQSRGMLL